MYICAVIPHTALLSHSKLPQGKFLHRDSPIRKIRPFLSEHATQLLVQALVLSRLDYSNALLAGLPANSIKPLQLIQNAAARLIFNELKTTRHTSVHQFALATNSCSHKIQGINVCLQNHLWLCTSLPKFNTSDLCAL